MNNQQFPIPFPPDPRLPLGQWVQTQHFDDCPSHPEDPRYYKQQGIIIGYEFNHPAWSLQHHIQAIAIDNQAPQGWDYRVLVFRYWDDASNSWSEAQGECQIENCFESDVTPIDPVQTFITLDRDAIHRLFWGEVLDVLTHPKAKVQIQSDPYCLKLIAPDHRAASRLWLCRYDIPQVVKTYHLPKDIVILASGECLYRFTADTPSIKLGNHHVSLIMPTSTKLDPSNDLRTLERLFNSPHVAAITAHKTNTCLLITDQGSPDNLIWQPAQYSGHNWLWSWQESMAQYRQLMQRLEQQGKVENFTYRFRDVDGSLSEYKSNFEMVESFQGVPCRLCFDLESKEIEPARVMATG